MNLSKIHKKKNSYHPLPKLPRDFLNFIINCKINNLKKREEVSIILHYFQNSLIKHQGKNLYYKSHLEIDMIYKKIHNPTKKGFYIIIKKIT